MTYQLMGSSQLTITNARTKALTIFIEPWGDVLTLEPGEFVEASFHSASDGVPQIEHADNGLILWGWAGATVILAKSNGEVLDYDIPVPDSPPGTSTSDFLRDMLGQPRTDSQTD